MTVWECQLRDIDTVTEQLIDFIENAGPTIDAQ